MKERGGREQGRESRREEGGVGREGREREGRISGGGEWGREREQVGQLLTVVIVFF